MDHVEFARLGGNARAKKLNKAQRSKIARDAVNARWAKARAAKKNGRSRKVA